MGKQETIRAANTVTGDTEMPFGFMPNHDETARLAFVGALKKYANFNVEQTLEQVYDSELVPQHEAAGNPAPHDRKSAADLLEPHPLFGFWGTLTFHSQNLMWDAVQRTTDRTIDSQIAQYQAIAASDAAQGSVELSDEVLVKAPVATTEIHRQPGGYWREQRPDDIEAALNYSGTVELYRIAKGMSAGDSPPADAFGRFVSGVARKYAPDLAPTAILDMGCGTGEQTLAYKREFPDAEVHAIDCARPFIRFAHGYAESAGVPVHFAEMDAGATRFEDESFDLIVSIIMFHETSTAQARDIMTECHRLLRPGGLALHLDVPYQPSRIPPVKQVTNNWQVRHNGEPFWSGFADLDMREVAIEAGFDEDKAFANYEAVGPAAYHFFGGRKSG
ncbi:MAG: methyltransferase domain-containing protein [Pseudomonadota bacterium]